jgi:hypothetical protein
MSNPIEQFVQLANSTFPAQGPAYVRGDELPWTAARQQDFAMLSMFLEGRDNLDFFSSGTDIVTLFDGEIANTQFGPKRMADDHRRPAGGTMNKMATPFTEYEWGQEITWHEINLQGDSIFSDSNSQRFYSILQKRNKDFTLDALKKMEKALGAAPSSTMFTDSGTGMLDLKSLWTFCNVWEDQHYATGVSGEFKFENLFPGADGNPLTPTIQGLAPGDFAREDSYGKEYTTGGSQLAPTKVQYAPGGNGDGWTGQNPSDPTINNILDQMQYMLDLLDWKPVPLAGEFAEGLQLEPKAILCTREAKRYFQRTNRAHGELFATIAPIGNPSQGTTARYGAIPLMTADTLRDAKLYPDYSGGAGTEAAAAPVTERNTDGRVGGYYYFLDPRTVNLWFHTNRGWEQDAWESMAPINKDVMFRLGRFLGNVHYERFISNGILMPSASITSYA